MAAKNNALETSPAAGAHNVSNGGDGQADGVPPFEELNVADNSKKLTVEDKLYGTSPEVEKYNRERYGLKQLHKLTENKDPDVIMLSLGVDPLKFGIGENRSPGKEEAYHTFHSPWDPEIRPPYPESMIPQYYYSKDRALARGHLQKFTQQTLLYMFYNIPRENVQWQAAVELTNRGWQYHQTFKKWFLQDPETEQWTYFEPWTWSKRISKIEIDKSALFVFPSSTAQKKGEDMVSHQNVAQSQAASSHAMPLHSAAAANSAQHHNAAFVGSQAHANQFASTQSQVSHLPSVQSALSASHLSSVLASRYNQLPQNNRSLPRYNQPVMPSNF
eukprot:Selendium_serpulae@DN4840_c0_g1_i4.p1